LAGGLTSTKVNWIVDADIAGFFDAVSHEWLMRFVEYRVGDSRILRLIRKWMKAGVMEDGNLLPTEAGTPQGLSSHLCWPISIFTMRLASGPISGARSMPRVRLS
jgi:retron-type reverse transcriptase